MKQQFFVGDVVEVVAVDSDNWYRVGEKFVVTGWNNGVYASPKDPDHITVDGADEGLWVEAKHVRILVRAWQKNTGVQPVNNDVEVLVKYADSTIDRAEACMFDWYAGDIGSIVEWRIADGLSSNVEQPEAIPPSHVALGEEMVSTSVSTEQDKKHSHYFKKCGYDYVDVYRVLKMFDVTDPCISHACKKLLVTGGRGFKDTNHDIQDVIDTLVRWQEMRKEDSDG